jgi:hypothetical protein
MKFKLIIFLSCAFITPNLFACDNATESYFSWANLKVVPANMSDPLDKIDIQKRKRSGESYYVQLSCDSGEVISVTKYLKGRVFISYEYLHQTDGRILILTTNPEGKVSKYYAN